MNEFQATYGRGARVINAIDLAVTTNGSGDVTWVFPTAFPTALVGYQLTDVSSPGSIGAVVLKGWPQSSGFTTRQQVSFRAYDTAGAAIGSFGLIVNITAWGY